MKRSPLTQIGVWTTAALLAAGCATGRTPQQSPGPGAGAGNVAAGSTTGDVDACAVALGNAGTAASGAGGGGTTGTPGPAGGTTGTTGTTGGPAGNPGAAGMGTAASGTATSTEATANGVMIGNVALVGLPSADNMPLTGTTGGTGTTGATGRGVTGTTGTPGATGTTGTPGNTGATGTNTTIGAGGAGAAGPTAVDRIRSACRGVTEIRVVTDAADRARLAQISSAIRKGQPITSFISDIARMSAKAAVYTGAGGGGAPANR